MPSRPGACVGEKIVELEGRISTLQQNQKASGKVKTPVLPQALHPAIYSQTTDLVNDFSLRNIVNVSIANVASHLHIDTYTEDSWDAM